MPATYEKIATTTLGSAAANITFSSIPATYTDLRLVFVGTGTTSVGLFGRINGDTGNNYSYTNLRGNGTSALSGRVTNIPYLDLQTGSNLSTTIPQMKTLDVFSYAGSTYKTILHIGAEDTNGSGNTIYEVCLWRSTSAINSISLYVDTSTIATGSTATLYGILKA